MLRSLSLAIAVALVTTAAAPLAQACPPGPCLKYRNVNPHDLMGPTQVVSPTMYTRPLSAPFPRFSYAGVARFLASTKWTAELSLLGPLAPNQRLANTALRFVTAANISRGDANTRVVLIRRIEQRANAILVEVDGSVWMLSRCGTRRAPLICLTEHGEMSFDPIVDSVDSVDGRFAKPPGQ